jgi:hypothetical protein
MYTKSLHCFENARNWVGGHELVEGWGCEGVEKMNKFGLFGIFVKW